MVSIPDFGKFLRQLGDAVHNPTSPAAVQADSATTALETGMRSASLEERLGDGRDPLRKYLSGLSQAQVTTFGMSLGTIMRGAARIVQERDRAAEQQLKLIKFINTGSVQEPTDTRTWYSGPLASDSEKAPVNASAYLQVGAESQRIDVQVQQSGKPVDLYSLSTEGLAGDNLEFIINTSYPTTQLSSLDENLDSETRNSIRRHSRSVLASFIKDRAYEVERLSSVMRNFISQYNVDEITNVTFIPANMDPSCTERSIWNTYRIELRSDQPPVQILQVMRTDNLAPFSDGKIDQIVIQKEQLYPQSAIMKLVDPKTKVEFDARIAALLKSAQERSPIT